VNRRSLSWFLALVTTTLLPLWWLIHPSASLAAMANAQDPPPAHYVCESEPLIAEVHIGAVDAPGIPNTAAGTVPGAFIVLQWRGVSLQLPRTNNAGIPSYSDGRWWWQALDPGHPDFAQRRGDWENYSCAAEP
jgi:hypothetical protein